MTPTSVGMRCPECSREKTKVRTARTIQRGSEPIVTYTLIAVNVIAYLAEGSSGSALAGSGTSGSLLLKGALDGPAIAAQHQYYRLLTSGFLHLNIEHIFFNMLFLYFLGRMLEPSIGRLNFAVVYFVSLLAGSFGALLFTPDALTVGASGAAFGVLGAMMVVAHDRRIPIWSSGLGITLVINIVFSLTYTGISLGGHVGGFVGGLICGAAIVRLGERRDQKWAALAVCAIVAVASVAAALAVAGQTGLTPNGLTL
jgi:membrane associated rhomboid family serine protease